MPLHADRLHDAVDLFDSDGDTHSNRQFGVDASDAVTAARYGVAGDDEFGKHVVSNPSSMVGVRVRRPAGNPTRHAQTDALPGRGCDDREPPFGRMLVSRSISAASFVAASSSSRAAIVRSASRNCWDSIVVVPGRSPRSIRSCWYQWYIVASATPESAATARTDRPPPTRATARRRNSADYILGTQPNLPRILANGRIKPLGQVMTGQEVGHFIGRS